MQGRLSPEEIAAIQTENETLKARLTAEQQRGEAESRRADGLHGQVLASSRQVAEAHVQGLHAQEQQAEGQITSLTDQIGALQAQRLAALQEGNFEKEGELNLQISEAVATRRQAQQAKTYFAQQRQQAATQPADPVERFIADRPNLIPAEKDWIRANPRYATDTEFHHRVNAAHSDALTRGMQRHSTEYYQELERAGYLRQPMPGAIDTRPGQQPASADDLGEDGGGDDNPYSEAADVVVEDEPVVQPQRPAPRAGAAPPSRRSPTVAAGNRQTTRLTPEQADTALRLAAELAPDTIKQGGDAAIYKWYAELNGHPTAGAIREAWAP